LDEKAARVAMKRFWTNKSDRTVLNVRAFANLGCEACRATFLNN
jgi:hypothetical protein